MAVQRWIEGETDLVKLVFQTNCLRHRLGRYAVTLLVTAYRHLALSRAGVARCELSHVANQKVASCIQDLCYRP